MKKEIRFVVTRAEVVGGWRRGNWMKVVKRYKIAVIRQISTGNVRHSMMTIVDTTVWYI